MTKIDIFSGFLGAGKTTLIKKLIKEAYVGEKVVLIENEFGEIGIDGGFLQEAGINITEMNSGCICCSLVGDFSKALKRVMQEYAPERIVIEPSGVGKLSDVIKAVASANLQNATLNAFCTVVDASKCKMYLKNFSEFFGDQIENASCIVLSRSDVVSAEKLGAAIDLLKAKNPAATIVTAAWNKLDGKKLLSAIERKDSLQKELEKLFAEVSEHHHEHHEHHHHEHECHDPNCECHHHEHHEHHEHHHHADEVFTSWGVETARKYTQEELLSALKALEEENVYGTVLRAKGIVAGETGWWHFDYVPESADVREGAAGVTGRLCVIGCNLDEEKLKALFKA